MAATAEAFDNSYVRRNCKDEALKLVRNAINFYNFLNSLSLV